MAPEQHWPHLPTRLAGDSALRGAGLTIQNHTSGGGHTIRLAGELDLHTAPSLDELLRRLAADATEIVLDLRQLSFMDSAGIHLILFTQDRCERQHCGFRIVGVGPSVQRILELSGIIELDGDGRADALAW